MSQLILFLAVAWAPPVAWAWSEHVLSTCDKYLGQALEPIARNRVREIPTAKRGERPVGLVALSTSQFITLAREGRLEAAGSWPLDPSFNTEHPAIVRYERAHPARLFDVEAEVDLEKLNGEAWARSAAEFFAAKYGDKPEIRGRGFVKLLADLHPELTNGLNFSFERVRTVAAACPISSSNHQAAQRVFTVARLLNLSPLMKHLDQILVKALREAPRSGGVVLGLAPDALDHLVWGRGGPRLKSLRLEDVWSIEAPARAL